MGLWIQIWWKEKPQKLGDSFGCQWTEPRSDEDKFYLARFIVWPQNQFVPRKVIRSLLDNKEHWKKNVEPIFYLAWAANYGKMFFVAWRYFKAGELTWFKVRQYASFRQLISQ